MSKNKGERDSLYFAMNRLRRSMTVLFGRLGIYRLLDRLERVLSGRWRS